MVPIVLFGIGLCLLYQWTESLYPGIALHALNNSIPLAAALHWTWQTPVLMVRSTLAALAIARLSALRLGGLHRDQSTSTAW
jgi:membrane protease YdiL (CAAX protease family)